MRVTIFENDGGEGGDNATKLLFKGPLAPKWLLLLSPMLMDPHPSQKHALVRPACPLMHATKRLL